MEEAMRIGQLAGRLAINPRTIRFYERAGLLLEPSAQRVATASTATPTSSGCGSSRQPSASA
jgi:hypothetical protein